MKGTSSPAAPGVRLLADGSLSVPGAGSQSERFGSTSTATGANSCALGYTAQANASGAIAIGQGCQVAGVDAVCIGRNIATGSTGVAIGANASNWNGAVGVGGGVSAGQNGVAIGLNAGAGAQQGVFVGAGAAGSGVNNIGIGYNASVTGSGGATNSIGIGAACVTGFTQVICIGGGATATAANQCLLGGTNTPITDLFVGKGVTSATPATATVQPTGGNGSGVAGARLNLAGGKGGAADTAGGAVAIQTAAAGAGTTLADRILVEANGNIAIHGAGSYGGGVGGVIFLADATTPPTTAPVGGVVLWSQGGVLKAMGASGVPTDVAL